MKMLFNNSGLNFDWVPVISPTMCVSHPLFDPLILIFCMSEYRLINVLVPIIKQLFENKISAMDRDGIVRTEIVSRRVQ